MVNYTSTGCSNILSVIIMILIYTLIHRHTSQGRQGSSMCEGTQLLEIIARGHMLLVATVPMCMTIDVIDVRKDNTTLYFNTFKQHHQQ